MNLRTTQIPGLTATLTAHRDELKSLLLISLTADAPAELAPRKPLRVALVIDRSGSMGGQKLAITRAAVAQFIRSLNPDDQVAVVTYDDNVDLMTGLVAPSEELARRVERIESGGSTNLYGGWVMGAKLVGPGGRVILLSDGLANVGRYTDARNLAHHAGISYEKFGVTTTTVGVGRDYDEALMAGMARHGGGAHYFAHEAHAITDAFDQERYSADAVLLQSVSVRCNGVTEQVGHFWGGESKNRVFAINRLDDLKVTVRYTRRATGETLTESLGVPSEFGYSENVGLEWLLHQAAEAEAGMIDVRDPSSATRQKERLREVVLGLLAHPMSDDPAVAATIDRLRASIERLEQLAVRYSEEDAMMHRKRSMQSSHNMRERAKAYSSFEDEQLFVQSAARSAMIQDPAMPEGIDPDALRLAPIESWIRWEALPVQAGTDFLIVAMEDHRRGFVISEIEQATGRRVRAIQSHLTSAEIVERLQAF